MVAKLGHGPRSLAAAASVEDSSAISPTVNSAKEEEMARRLQRGRGEAESRQEAMQAGETAQRGEAG